MAHASSMEGSSKPVVPSTSSQVCRLLTLSAELRNQIYAMVLIEPCKVITIYQLTQRDTHTKKTAMPGLLQTCRQIRSEASGIHYSSHKLFFFVPRLDIAPRYITQPVLDWLQTVDCMHLNSIPAISIRLSNYTRQPEHNALWEEYRRLGYEAYKQGWAPLVRFAESHAMDLSTWTVSLSLCQNLERLVDVPRFRALMGTREDGEGAAA